MCLKPIAQRMVKTIVNDFESLLIGAIPTFATCPDHLGRLLKEMAHFGIMYWKKIDCIFLTENVHARVHRPRV